MLHKRVAGGSHFLLSVPNAAHPPSFASPPRWAGSRRSSWHWYSHYVLVPAHETACKRTVLGSSPSISRTFVENFFLVTLSVTLGRR